MFSALLLTTFLTCAMPLSAQDGVEFGRLATEQRQVADQLRRLESLLGVLEERDRAEGRVERADLLQQAAERLAAAEESGDLAAVVEGLAREIGAMHSGNALEGQQKLIAVLQELLDFLISNERREQEILQMKSLEERLAALEKFIADQQQVLEQTEKLEEQLGQSGTPQPSENQPQADPTEPTDPTEESAQALDPSAAEQLEKLREELAKLQTELAEKLEEFNREQQRESGRKSEDAEKAQDAAEDAAEEMREQSAETEPKSPSEQLQEAIAKQQEALKNLEQAKKQTEKKFKQAKQAERDKILLDVEQEAERILALHREIDVTLAEVAAAVGEEVVPRSARAQLRQAAAAELDLALAATKMMATIDEAGADSFPFYINLLAQDHLRLSKTIGPPRYHLQASSLQVSAALTASWVSLIDAIRTERERNRLQMEQDQAEMPGGQSPPQDEQNMPLVNFALELQLLKRMQSSISDQLELLNNLQDAYQQVGLAMDQEELADLEQLLNRQKSLQLQFESMVARLSGIEEQQKAEDM
jgi:hypothetical protein